MLTIVEWYTAIFVYCFARCWPIMARMHLLLQCWIRWIGLLYRCWMLMGTSIHGTVEEQECGGKLEAEDTGVMELIQTGIGISNGEVCRVSLRIFSCVILLSQTFSAQPFLISGVGTSSSECRDTYRGTRPFSEIEVYNVANYLSSNRNRLAGYMDIHAYSQLWMTPWGYTKTYPKDYREMVSNSIKIHLSFSSDDSMIPSL